jgi:hypothetical protein
MTTYESLGPKKELKRTVPYKQKPANTFHQKMRDLGTKYSDTLKKQSFKPNLPKLTDPDMKELINKYPV